MIIQVLGLLALTMFMFALGYLIGKITGKEDEE